MVATNVVAVDTIVSVVVTTISSGGVVVGRSVGGGRMCAGAGGIVDVDAGVAGRAGIVVGVRVDSLVGDFVTST